MVRGRLALSVWWHGDCRNRHDREVIWACDWRLVSRVPCNFPCYRHSGREARKGEETEREQRRCQSITECGRTSGSWNCYGQLRIGRLRTDPLALLG